VTEVTKIMVPAGTKIAKSGRPIQSHCKRGHVHIPNQPCRARRNLRLKWKYHDNKEYREKKKQAKASKLAFFEKNGFRQDKLYDRKPKARAAQ